MRGLCLFASAEVKDAADEGKAETFFYVVQIAIRDADDVILSVCLATGSIGGSTFSYNQG